ncbi:sulfotransferase [Thiohalocapsa marina]|uniref:Sulfotransferase n=1 Tax=Thiohalocapsa marina TaxID=424902 RepID=A0A5M8FVJ0_9GAMM|nr:sulfotransferase [Thiohalocapsa marina]KAA6187848.1 sulfotransferase [Thiohalocapsa marina]
MHDPLSSLCLVIGNARSGSTLIGALLDRHPAVACANESQASEQFWHGYDREALCAELLENAARQRDAGRPSAGYQYGIEGSEKAPSAVRVLGDKIWNPALLMLHGKPDLLAHLGQLLGCPVRLVHSIRNPFDAIAAMHARSGAPLLDRARWYFMHCDAASALRARHPEHWLDVHHEHLINAPEQTLTALLAHLELTVPPDFIEACRGLMYASPRRRAAEIDWDTETLRFIEGRMAQYPFLQCYPSVADGSRGAGTRPAPDAATALRPAETIAAAVSDEKPIQAAQTPIPRQQADRGEPELTAIVVMHDMMREAPRTLYSLSRAYQRALDGLRYRVLVLDHGSREPLPAGLAQQFDAEIEYRFVDTDAVSPVAAINAAAAEVVSPMLMLNIDGARILSPGLLGWLRRASLLFADPLVYTLGWHLGPDLQNRSMLEGYDQTVEDRLLREADWRADGYRLFEISTLAGSSEDGFFGMPAESNCFAMRTATFHALGGFDERFASPGGGLANHDLFARTLAIAGIQPVCLLGEGSFHQIHGGVASNAPAAEHPWPRYQAEYRAIRGHEWQPTDGVDPVYLGRMPSTARRFIGTAEAYAAAKTDA